MRNIRCVRGIGDNDGGGRGQTKGMKNLRRLRRHWRRKMRTKTTITTTDESTEDKRRVQGIKDNGGGGSRLTTSLVNWKRQHSVDFTSFQVANSNTVSSQSSRCLVLILFSSDYFPPVRCMKYYQYCNHKENFLYQVYTNLEYVPPTYRRIKKLRVLMINKDVHKSLSCNK